MSDLICEHYDLLLVITRFGIPLGLGEKTVQDVCKDHNVHMPTLLAVINTVGFNKKLSENEIKELSALALINYLKNSHTYFIEYRLPLLRRHLHQAIEGGPKDLTRLIFQFFDEYTTEVEKHMGYENNIVFPYVSELIEKNQKKEDYNIDKFSKKHDKIEDKIIELKNILIKYYPDGTGYALNTVLHEIFGTEEDLSSHNFIEDTIFVPLIRMMEKA